MHAINKHPFNGFFSRATWVSRQARNDGVAVASAGTYANNLCLTPER